MNESIKAALWSFCIFPGGGHLYLGKWISGVMLGGTAFVALAFVLARILDRANQIAEKIILGEIPLDFGVIMDLVSAQTTAGDSTLDTAWYILIGIWLIAALDAFRLGRRVDRQRTSE